MPQRYNFSRDYIHLFGKKVVYLRSEMKHNEIYSAAQLTAFIQEVGFLPLLDSGIQGFSAEEIVTDDCRYVVFDDGGWDWPLWKWKGPIVSEGSCVYGKFFNKKAGFISRAWWPDFCNYRRSKYPVPVEGTIDESSSRRSANTAVSLLVNCVRLVASTVPRCVVSLWLCHPPTNGMPYRHRGLRISH